jgi:hypothetical protein
VGEKVDYPGGNPYSWPSPPWFCSTDNPTIIDLPAIYGYFADNHSPGSFITPYQNATFSAYQIYRYRCYPCGEYQILLDIGPITRFVTGGEPPFPDLWRYSIIKSGAYAEIFPL